MTLLYVMEIARQGICGFWHEPMIIAHHDTSINIYYTVHTYRLTGYQNMLSHLCIYVTVPTHSLQAARSYGYTLVSRSPGGCSILIPGGQLIRYKVLHLLEFDPVRKCMYVLYKITVVLVSH